MTCGIAEEAPRVAARTHASSHMAQSDSPDLTERTLSSETVFNGDLLHVCRDIVETPSGEAVREYITHPGASAVVPVFADGTTLLVRQYRYAARREFLEIPAGKIDPGETPESAAARELSEEVGLRSDAWTALGAVYTTVGYSDELIHLLRGGRAGERLHRGRNESVRHQRHPIRVARAPELAGSARVP